MVRAIPRKAVPVKSVGELVDSIESPDDVVVFAYLFPIEFVGILVENVHAQRLIVRNSLFVIGSMSWVFLMFTMQR